MQEDAPFTALCRWLINRLPARDTHGGWRGLRYVTITLGVTVFAMPAAAQSIGDAFCQSALAQTLLNIIQVIQFGGPLLGGVVALGATVALPTVRRSDLKREIKTVRNQGVVWGVIVAPLGTTIIQFLLNNVVAGGASCSF